MQIDLLQPGVTLISTLAYVRAVHEEDGEQKVTAFSFEELPDDDLDRIVQLALKRQINQIRDQRKG